MGFLKKLFGKTDTEKTIEEVDLEKPDGPWEQWYDNGQKKEQGFYYGGKKEGLWIKWEESGRKWLEANYRNGVEHGQYWASFPSNADGVYPVLVGQWKNGQHEGLWTMSVHGEKIVEYLYSNGKLVKETRMKQDRWNFR